MTTPSRATAFPTHSSPWQTRPGTSSSRSQTTPTASDLSKLDLELSVQLELRAQLQEGPETDETKSTLEEIDNIICHIVKDMDRVRASLGYSMDEDFWGSPEGSPGSAGTAPTAQQQVRQLGNQVRQQQAQRVQQPRPQQQSQNAQQPQYAQQRQRPPLQQLQQRQQHHSQQMGQRQSRQGSHEQGQRQKPFQQLPQQHEGQINNAEDFQNSLRGFVPQEPGRKRSIGTSLGHEDLRNSESSAKRAASGSGTGNPTTLSGVFDASPFLSTDNDVNYFDDDFNFDDFDCSQVVDLTGYVSISYCCLWGSFKLVVKRY